MNITEPIRALASRSPAATAYARNRRGSYGYRDYDALLDAIAWRALDHGLAPGARVHLLVEREFAYLTVALALARVGMVAVRPAADDARCDAWVVSQAVERPPSGRVLAIEPGWFEAPRDARPAPMHPGGDAPCVEFATSGTTGRPKRVALSHAHLIERGRRRLLALALPQPLVLLAKVSVQAAYGFQVSLCALREGGTVVEPADVSATRDTVARHGVTWLVAPPAMVLRLAAEFGPAAEPLPSLRLLEVSGSLLSERAGELATARICANVAVVYGSTEASIVACSPLEAVRRLPNSVGRVAPGVACEIVDEAGLPLPPGREGAVRVRSDGCVRAYADGSGSGREFRDGWFHPGDVGTLTGDGMLVLHGRVDERFNVGGVKIAPEEVEAIASDLPGVEDVAAFALESTSGITRVGLAIVAGPAFDFDACRAAWRERLGVFTPEVVLRMASIPRNENAKTDRRALAHLAAAHAPGAVAAGDGGTGA